MSKLINECSLKDATVLKNLILENPNLPLLVFCGEDSYTGDYGHNQAYVSNCEVEELTLYEDMWLNEEDYANKLTEDLSYEEEYKDMTNEEYDKMIDEKVASTEFVKAIIVWVG